MKKAVLTFRYARSFCQTQILKLGTVTVKKMAVGKLNKQYNEQLLRYR